MGFSSQYQYEIQDEVIIYSVDYTSTDNPIDMSEFELPPEVPDMSDPENDPSKLKTTWVYTIRSKKKRNIFKIDFLISLFIKIHHTIYQIKHNWMNFMIVKTASKNILQ